jgi:hypothetical protein
MTNPAALFVEPNVFDAATLPANMKQAAEELRKLRRELFSGSSDGSTIAR